MSATASTEIDTALLAVSEWLNDLPEAVIYVIGVTMIKAFALTLSMNRTRERHPTQHFLSVSEFVDLLQKIVFSNGALENNIIYYYHEIANMVQKIRGRAFFTTEDGHIGTASGGTQPGLSNGMIILLAQ